MAASSSVIRAWPVRISAVGSGTMPWLVAELSATSALRHSGESASRLSARRKATRPAGMWLRPLSCVSVTPFRLVHTRPHGCGRIARAPTRGSSPGR